MPPSLAKCVGFKGAGASLISVTSQIATKPSSEDVHKLRMEAENAGWQNVNMSDEKNGGPNFLRDWRDYRKLTQEELAAAVRTSASVISMLETGDRQLNAKWLRKLAPVLGTSPGFLLDHNPYELNSDILEIWNRAAPEQQEQIIALAETVVKFRPKDGTSG